MKVEIIWSHPGVSVGFGNSMASATAVGVGNISANFGNVSGTSMKAFSSQLFAAMLKKGSFRTVSYCEKR